MQNEGSYKSWLGEVQHISLSFNSAGLFPFRLEVIHSLHLFHYYSRGVPGKGLSVLLQDDWILMNMPSTLASETPSLSLTNVSGLKTANLKCCKVAIFSHPPTRNPWTTC